MVIESVVICIDNSDYMRNEDYPPSRLTAQCEAADLIIQTKLRSHPENHVAIIGFSTNRVLTNLTTDETKLLTELYKIQSGGEIRFLQGLSVAQLVLKHRPVKTHKCRIIAFVGSPVKLSENEVVTLGKRFKKENVAVDVIRFGVEEGHEELGKLVATVSGNGGNNTFVSVPQNVVICDFLVSTSIVSGPNRGTVHFNEEDDDEDLRRALEMSLRDAENTTTATPTTATTARPTGMQDGNALSDDEQLALAIQLSLQEAERVNAPPAAAHATPPPANPPSGNQQPNGSPDKNAKGKKSENPPKGKSSSNNNSNINNGEDSKNRKTDKENANPPPPSPKK